MFEFVEAGSLKTRLLALVLLLVVPALVLLLAANLKNQRSEKELAKERASTIARLAAAQESYFVRQTRHQLATMTQFPLVLMQDRALTEKGLKSLKRLQPDYEDFGLVELDGTVFCHTLGSNITETVNPALLPDILATRDFVQTVFRSGLEQKHLRIQFGYPVLATNGAVARMMYASLKTHLLTDALTNVSLPEGGEVTVFDRKGNVLARHPDPEKWVGQRLETAPFIQKSLAQNQGILETAGLDGVQRLYAVSTVRDGGKPLLFVTVGILRSDVFREANRTLIRNSLLVLVLLSLLLFMARWYSNRVFLQPASAIMKAADQISGGDLRARTGLSDGTTELHRLAKRFDQMAANLERRQAELEQANRAVKVQNEQLEARVTERTRELQMLNRELEAFSYSVSHDLRAPLRHLDGFAQLLLKNPRLQEDPRSQRHLLAISGAAKEMGVLIDDLLSFSKMGRQSLTMGKVDFSQLVTDVVAETVAQNPERNIDWKIETLPEVSGDAAMLRQVWVNLLSNAVKYTRHRNPAIIAVTARPEGAETVFSVQDNGAGFEMQYSDKLFGVFQRLHRSEDFEGNGIGLANVRRIIGRHGGRTWAVGKVNEGATFSFSLPKSESAQP